MKAPREPGRVITFYSYKGGTGRSMALSNVAWVLAAAGKSVLLIDWDLEAPGLHRYFKPFLTDHELGASDGLMNLIDAYTSEAIKPLPESGQLADDWWRPLTDVSDYVLPIEFEHFPPGGRIDLLGAGRQCPNYAVLVNSFNWQNFYESLGGGGFLDAVKNAAAQEYDYILIDSRTGVSDTAGICTAQMPDTLVVCFTYNNQSIKGTQAVAESAITQRAQLVMGRRQQQTKDTTGDLAYSPRPYRVFPIPMRADTSESDRLSLRQSFARESFNSFLDTGAIGDKAQYWARVEVPYWPLYAYEEVLSPLRDDPHSTKSVLYAFTQIARYLTDGEISSYSLPLAPALRQEYLDAFAETPQSSAAKQVALEASRETADEAMIRRAEEVIHSLADEDRQLARSVLCRLMRVGKVEEGGRHHPIRMSPDEFGTQQQSMVAQLADRGVLAITSRASSSSSSSQSEQVVGFADERMPLLWPTLKGWLDDDLAFLVWRQQLREYRNDWARTGEKTALLGGTVLSEARQWARQRLADLNEAEQAFIEASAAAALMSPSQLRAFPQWATLVGAVLFMGIIAITLITYYFKPAPLLSKSSPTTVSMPELMPVPMPELMPVPMPELIGSSIQEAQTIAKQSGLQVQTFDEVSGAEQVFEAGVVTRQEPAGRSSVRLFVTTAPRVVPLVFGLDTGSAIEALRKSGLKIEIGSPVSTAGTKTKPGTIVRQSPVPGTTVAAGRLVVVNIAEAPKPVLAKAALDGYKVAIFYYWGEAPGEELAKKIAKHLGQSGLNRVELRSSSEQFMREKYPPTTVEIRFESGAEDTPADTLLALVQQVDGVGKPRRFAVTNQTPKYLSIFIPSEKADVKGVK